MAISQWSKMTVKQWIEIDGNVWLSLFEFDAMFTRLKHRMMSETYMNSQHVYVSAIWLFSNMCGRDLTIWIRVTVSAIIVEKTNTLHNIEKKWSEVFCTQCPSVFIYSSRYVLEFASVLYLLPSIFLCKILHFDEDFDFESSSCYGRWSSLPPSPHPCLLSTHRQIFVLHAP